MVVINVNNTINKYLLLQHLLPFFLKIVHFSDRRYNLSSAMSSWLGWVQWWQLQLSLSVRRRVESWPIEAHEMKGRIWYFYVESFHTFSVSPPKARRWKSLHNNSNKWKVAEGEQNFFPPRGGGSGPNPQEVWPKSTLFICFFRGFPKMETWHFLLGFYATILTQ